MPAETSLRDAQAGDGQVAIIGLGYVGLTLAVVAADCGYRVLGVEIRSEVLDALQRAQAHFSEPGIDRRLQEHLASGHLTARRELLHSDRCTYYIITVGTPIGPDKQTRIAAIASVARTIAERLQPNDLVILRSTVRVGVTREVVKPILDQAHVAYHLAFCPERTIEGSALQELRQLPQIVGGIDEASRDLAVGFFSRIATEVIAVESVEAAELVKLINNTERDLRFAFANEIAAMCDIIGVAAYDVINACNHRYARSNLALPGPVGGPCLTKDPYILAEGLQRHGLTPQLALVGRETNEAVVGNAVAAVHNALTWLGAKSPVRRIAVLGLAFKGRPATDDLRGSTVFDLLHAVRRFFPDAAVVGYDRLVPADAIAELGMEPSDSIEAAFSGASAVFLHNNHPDLEGLPLARFGQSMAQPGIVYDFWGQNRAVTGLPPGIHVAGLGLWPPTLSAAARSAVQPNVA